MTLQEELAAKAEEKFNRKLDALFRQQERTDYLKRELARSERELVLLNKELKEANDQRNRLAIKDK